MSFSCSVLSEAPLSALGLLSAKMLLMPLLGRLTAAALGVTDLAALDFAFLYGMLPSAPSVVVFARQVCFLSLTPIISHMSHSHFPYTSPRASFYSMGARVPLSPSSSADACS